MAVQTRDISAVVTGVGEPPALRTVMSISRASRFDSGEDDGRPTPLTYSARVAAAMKILSAETHASTTRIAAEVVLSATAGFLACALPVVLDPDAVHHPAAFLPVVGDVAEGMKPYSLVLLFGIGFILGWIGSGAVWLTGPATAAVFPAWSVLDMALGGDHNLFPIEWLIYGMYSLCGSVGGVLGRGCRFLARRRGIRDGGTRGDEGW